MREELKPAPPVMGGIRFSPSRVEIIPPKIQLSVEQIAEAMRSLLGSGGNSTVKHAESNFIHFRTL